MQKQYLYDSTEYVLQEQWQKWIIKLHFYKHDFHWPIPLDYVCMHAAFIYRDIGMLMQV